MSDYFKVRASVGEYGVFIGQNCLEGRIHGGAGQIVLCDAYFSEKYQTMGLKVVSVDATEASKSLDRMSEIIIQLKALGANRHSRLFAVGGGIIQDIATFSASLYMRGLKWDYAPTTLLGMVDSCIGGKSSINVGKYKNLIGNFYPPETILIDLSFVHTLTPEQKIAGLCEAIKICFAHGDQSFNDYIALNPTQESSKEKFQSTISLTLQSKRWFVEVDEQDQKERQLLNYGHTFGHAIEGASNYAIPHGIAVGLGMMASIEFAIKYGHFQVLPARVQKLEQYLRSLLDSLPDLPRWLGQVSVDELMDRFSADKKHSETHYALIVPDATGHLMRLQLEKNEISRQLIFSTFLSVCQSINTQV